MPLIFFLLAFNVRATAFETQVVPSDSSTLRELFDKDTFNEKKVATKDLWFIVCVNMYLNEWVSCEVIVLIVSDFSSSSFQCQGKSYWGLSCLIHRFCWSFLIRQLHLGVRNNQFFVVINKKGSRSLLLWHNKQVHTIFCHPRQRSWRDWQGRIGKGKRC